MLERLSYALSTNFDPKELLLSFAVSAILAGITTAFYLKMADNKFGIRPLARTFLPLALVMAMVASVFASSAALALGLVGAMSVIRYRSSIESIEGLNYLFLSLAVGLGAGTGQRWLTALAVVLILGILAYRKWATEEVFETHTLSISCPSGNSLKINSLLTSLLPEFILLEFHSGPDTDKWQVICHQNDPESLESLRLQLREISQKSRFCLSHENG